MVQHFLEMEEILSDEDQANHKLGILIRVRVTGKADAISKKPKYIGDFTGKPYKASHHVCLHPKGKCTKEEI